ncbi:MAG: FeoB-associated Cys-rich membrane protein [Deltaproteobacteria bacterium]|nr:FeoB-associated Cys-rich membrane protein [Deltaproteobacteria bacterium]
MFQPVIVILVLFVALLFMGRHFYRTLTSRSSDCGCGSGASCPANLPEECGKPGRQETPESNGRG